MRYAVMSDIHANLEAFEAVVAASKKEKIDRYLCIGDIVGYGADPKETIRLVRFLKPEAIVAGNHDMGAIGNLDVEYFNEDAQSAILWTKGELNHGEIDYLASFEFVYTAGDFTLVHGSLEAPSEFHYILNKGDAYITMQLSRTRLCFVGHSHIPEIFYSGPGGAERAAGVKINIEPDKKYLINVGSIGQPRDGNPKSSYAVYDTDANTVEIKRVSYCMGDTKDKILKAGLPSFLAYRILEGR